MHLHLFWDDVCVVTALQCWLERPTISLLTMARVGPASKGSHDPLLPFAPPRRQRQNEAVHGEQGRGGRYSTVKEERGGTFDDRKEGMNDSRSLKIH
jgi:hypothetical protein